MSNKEPQKTCFFFKSTFHKKMDGENENDDDESIVNKRKKKDLTESQINSIISFLLDDLVYHHGERVPRPGRMRIAAQRFGGQQAYHRTEVGTREGQ